MNTSKNGNTFLKPDFLPQKKLLALTSSILPSLINYSFIVLLLYSVGEAKLNHALSSLYQQIQRTVQENFCISQD